MLFDEFEQSNKAVNFTEGLNPEQAAAVNHINGPMLIIAGAGSGKTRVITNRIANLIANGVAPWNILALTFTNKAAGEMKSRIGKMIKAQTAEKIWAGTFHSIFARLLRSEAERIGYDSNFSIYDTDDSLSLIKKVFDELRLTASSSSFTPQAVRGRISSMKNKLVTWQHIHDNPNRFNDKEFAEIYRKYQEKLRANNAMDFDDLLWNFINVLELHPDILSKYQERFKYILVDEYQDTNFSQYKAIRLLGKHYSNVCVVGDDAQSIYGWRGADISNILNFQSDYPNCKVFKLEQNYRSTKTILQAADCVIKNNIKQLKKTLHTENPQGEKITLKECDSDFVEADFIISNIKNKLNDGNSVKDFAVLYRTNAQSLEFEKACRKYRLPYIIIGGMSFFKRKEVKDVIAYLKILVNPKDSESLLRVVNEPTRGIGQTSLNHIIGYANQNQISLLEAFRSAEQVTALQKRAVNSIKGFAQFIDNYRDKMQVDTIEDFVNEYIANTGIIEMYLNMGTEEAKDKVRNIEQTVNDVVTFSKLNPENTLEDYLQQVALIADVDDKDFGSERLPLMTIHSAKGLEFKEVFIAGMEYGLFPLKRSEQSEEEEEEERRLFYVAITRAERKLYLTYATKRMKFGSVNPSAPSPFLKEIDKSLFEFSGSFRNTENFKPTLKPLAPKPLNSVVFNDIPEKDYFDQTVNQSASSFGFRIGDLVRHKQFGVGKVTGLAGQGTNRKATVNFSNFGKKQLLLQYAKLELVKRS